MSPTTYATRRLWLRRWNRLGFFLLPVLKIPCYPFLWVFWFLRAWAKSSSDKGSDLYFGGWVVIGITLGIAIIVGWNSHLTRDATAEELRVARAADGCFDNTIVRRAALWNRPITVSDVLQTQSDCAKMWDDIARKNAQKAALGNK